MNQNPRSQARDVSKDNDDIISEAEENFQAWVMLKRQIPRSTAKAQEEPDEMAKQKDIAGVLLKASTYLQIRSHRLYFQISRQLRWRSTSQSHLRLTQSLDVTECRVNAAAPNRPMALIVQNGSLTVTPGQNCHIERNKPTYLQYWCCLTRIRNQYPAAVAAAAGCCWSQSRRSRQNQTFWRLAMAEWVGE